MDQKSPGLATRFCQKVIFVCFHKDFAIPTSFEVCFQKSDFQARRLNSPSFLRKILLLIWNLSFSRLTKELEQCLPKILVLDPQLTELSDKNKGRDIRISINFVGEVVV